jgi:hypothetical protein
MVGEMSRQLAWALVLAGGVARAEPGVTGAIEGRVVDAATGRGIAGVEVTIARAHAISDEDGMYRITQVLPGTYDVTFDDAAGHAVVRRWMIVHAGGTTPVQARLDHAHAGRAEDASPGSVLDPADTGIGGLRSYGYAASVPLPGRTFEALLGTVPESQNDGFAAAFAGSTSAENRFSLNGASMTSPQYDGVGQTIPIELVDSVRVVTGGASSDDPGTTGALIEVVTKHGTDEFHGSVFTSWSPSFLVAAPRTPSQPPQTIDVRPTASTGDLGAELGGPIRKGSAWFYVAFAPMFTRVDNTRRILSLLDRDNNGEPDLDPRTGMPARIEVASEVRTATTSSYPIVARLDSSSRLGQAMASVVIVPWKSDQPGLYGLASTGTHTDGLTAHIATHASWKLLDDRLELVARAGWDYERAEVGGIDPTTADQPLQQLGFTTIPYVAKYGGESSEAVTACKLFPLITPCQLDNYAIGGPGQLTRDIANVQTADVSATYHVHMHGDHEVRVGYAVELDTLEHADMLSGGSLTLFPDYTERPVKIAPYDSPDPSFDHRCATSRPDGSPVDVACKYITSFADSARGYESDLSALYLRDRWRVLPNLSVQAGVRYENQRLLYGDDIRNTTSAVTGERIGENLLALNGQLSPRLGASYDPTHVGRAQVFASWGRSYEPVPLAVAMLSSSEGVEATTLGLRSVGTAEVIRSTPGLGGEYVDDLVAGGAYATDSDMASIAVHARRLGRAIEDVAIDRDPTTLANPGDGFAQLYNRAARNYTALVLGWSHWYSLLWVNASYTYSRTIGDYAGAIDYGNGQIEPNYTIDYDRVGMMANRLGALPVDRPHYIKLDASYSVPIGRDWLTFGASYRGLSGAPVTALGSSVDRGPNDVYLLPTSAFARMPFTQTLDVHLGFRMRKIRHATTEIYADIFNILDARDAFAIDPSYTAFFGSSFGPQNMLPISGGQYSDLIWAKQLDRGGLETNAPLVRNPQFHQPTAFYAPTSVRLGARVSF